MKDVKYALVQVEGNQRMIDLFSLLVSNGYSNVSFGSSVEDFHLSRSQASALHVNQVNQRRDALTSRVSRIPSVFPHQQQPSTSGQQRQQQTHSLHMPSDPLPQIQKIRRQQQMQHKVAEQYPAVPKDRSPIRLLSEQTDREQQLELLESSSRKRRQSDLWDLAEEEREGQAQYISHFTPSQRLRHSQKSPQKNQQQNRTRSPTKHQTIQRQKVKATPKPGTTPNLLEAKTSRFTSNLKMFFGDPEEGASTSDSTSCAQPIDDVFTTTLPPNAPQTIPLAPNQNFLLLPKDWDVGSQSSDSEREETPLRPVVPRIIEWQREILLQAMENGIPTGTKLDELCERCEITKTQALRFFRYRKTVSTTKKKVNDTEKEVFVDLG